MALTLMQGMAAAQAKRAAKALEEAMEAGVVKRKGRGKKLRAEKGEGERGKVTGLVVLMLAHSCC
jgi:hypothetical protein